MGGNLLGDGQFIGVGVFMNWPLIIGWFMAGLGVSIAMDSAMTYRHTDRWVGLARAGGGIIFVLFWPIVLVSLITLALLAVADR